MYYYTGGFYLYKPNVCLHDESDMYAVLKRYRQTTIEISHKVSQLEVVCLGPDKHSTGYMQELSLHYSDLFSYLVCPHSVCRFVHACAL